MRRSSIIRYQSGGTLIIALIFMVLLTVISLSTMHSSSFEIKVARSVKAQVDSLTAAEDALTAGESFLAGLTSIASFPSSSGYYQGASLASQSLTSLLSMPSSAATTSIGTGKVYIEYLGTPTPSGNSNSFGKPPMDIKHLFRITGVGQLDDASQVKVIQSYYATDE